MSEAPREPETTTRTQIDLSAIEARWAQRWNDERVHEPEVVEGKPKFFVTYPYSYMNAFAHVGHAFTMMRSDLFARYHRMKGHNTLYPFAFHVTGTPIVAAANRVAEGEEVQIRILREQGIPPEDIEKFSDPVHWVRYFPKEWRTDVQRLGLGVDWRREFITTDLNPSYDAFIRWQFGKLVDAGLVAKGRHPIIWCPKDEAPVADHDRYSGEGETPQEWALYKMPLTDGAPAGLTGKAMLIAATLRPDTVFGQTNVWVDAAATYRVLKVGDERWILNQRSAKDLAFQITGAEELPDFHVPGKELVGTRVVAPGTGAHIPVLPAAFIKHDKGTGIVTSVPSDSPQDMLSLKAVQEGHIDASQPTQELARTIDIIPVIRTEKYGTESAAKAIAETGARDHRDAERITQATEKAYQAGFYEGIMLDNAGQFAGQPVAKAKETIRAWLIERNEALLGYWPSGPVVCRCLTPSVVKIVSDQWFVRYGDDAWKEQTLHAMEKMTFYPPAVRKQFEYVVGWLRAWACTREKGLGTHLPQDPRWLIESLSDSTIYMAYYTIAHLLERGTVTGASGERAGVDPADLTNAFFDHVFLGKGNAKDAAHGTVTPAIVERARREFNYWYPLDFRNSGKDLVQNHLTFMVFNHTAIWNDETKWPRAIGVNGWVMVDGEKMSKSKGNFITLRQALDTYGISPTRFALASAGEGVDDANFDRDVANQAQRKLRAWIDLAANPDLGPARDGPHTNVDRWFHATLDRLITETRTNMEETNFRSALKTGFYDIQREWSWYVRRSAGTPHAAVRERFIRVQNAILTPFVPHIAEEVHAARNWPGLAIDAQYPEPQAEPDVTAEEAEGLVRNLLDDIRNILKVTKIEPKRMILITAPEWKRTFQQKALELAGNKELTVPNMMKTAMADPDIRAKGSKEAPKLAADAVKTLANLGPRELATRAHPLDETAILQESINFLETEFNCTVTVQNADAPNLEDPAGKARYANIRKPAIYME